MNLHKHKTTVQIFFILHDWYVIIYELHRIYVEMFLLENVLGAVRKAENIVVQMKRKAKCQDDFPNKGQLWLWAYKLKM